MHGSAIRAVNLGRHATRRRDDSSPGPVKPTQMVLNMVPILLGMLQDGLLSRTMAPVRVLGKSLDGDKIGISNKDIKVDKILGKVLEKVEGSTKASRWPCNLLHPFPHLLVLRHQPVGPRPMPLGCLFLLHPRLSKLQHRGETSAEQTLRLLAQQIQQNPDSATPEVLAIVQRHKIQGKKQYTKELHTAVKDLGQARQALDEAVNARSQLLARWRTFLDASLKQWKEYTDMFQAQEKSCQEQIALARDSVNKAKDEFAAKQSGDTHEISDDDGDFQEQASKESSSRILGGMQHMTSGLQQLSVQAEQAFQEEEARKLKRPRRAEEAADDVMATAPPQPEDAAPSQPAAPGTKAMQPFALPGQ